MGLPGAGKTSLVNAVAEIFEILNRKVIKVNLDFSNELEEDEYDFDCRNYVETSEVEQKLSLGPNGGVLEALEIFANGEGANELLAFVKEKVNNDKFFLFDTPGEVECFLSHGVLKSLFHTLEKEGLSIVSIWTGDATVMQQGEPYLEYEVSSMCVQNTLQLPFVKAVNKIDLFPDGLKLESLIKCMEEVVDLNSEDFSSRITEALLGMVRRNGGVRIDVSAMESASLVRLIIYCDMLLGYERGMNGEYTGIEIDRQREIEAFIEEAVNKNDNIEEESDEYWL